MSRQLPGRASAHSPDFSFGIKNLLKEKNILEGGRGRNETEEAGQVNSARVFLQTKGRDQVTGLEIFGQKANELPQSGAESQIS